MKKSFPRARIIQGIKADLKTKMNIRRPEGWNKHHLYNQYWAFVYKFWLPHLAQIEQSLIDQWNETMGCLQHQNPPEVLQEENKNGQLWAVRHLLHYSNLKRVFWWPCADGRRISLVPKKGFSCHWLDSSSLPQTLSLLSCPALLPPSSVLHAAWNVVSCYLLNPCF